MIQIKLPPTNWGRFMVLGMKTALVNAQISPELKDDVESILARLGVTTDQAITIYFEHIRMSRGLPFTVKIPNE